MPQLPHRSLTLFSQTYLQLKKTIGLGCTLVALIGAWLFFIEPPACQAAFPGTNGRIVFTSLRDDFLGDIYSMNADGSEIVRLTSSAGNDDSADWSPDGSQIVFTSRRDGNSEIYVMDADGSNQTRLTNHPADDFLPCWSPDGTKIAFTTDRDGAFSSIYVMNSDGSNPMKVGTFTGGPEGTQAWSPDGTRFAFTRYLGGTSAIHAEIFVMNVDGTNAVRLTTNSVVDDQPNWSPDGTQIVFGTGRDGNGEIYVINTDGSNPTRLTSHPASDQTPVWSPDGTQIAFTSERDDGSGRGDIFVMNADGSNQVNRTLNPVADRRPTWQPIRVTQTTLMVADTLNNRIQRFDGSTWSVIGTGLSGSGNGQFRTPEAVAFSFDEQFIYVADTGNNRIQWSTDAGITWGDFATSGTGPHQVKAPQGLALDREGNLYVADTGNGRVARFDGGIPGPATIIAANGLASGQVRSPRGLAISPTFQLFITDELASRILRINNANLATTSTSGIAIATLGTALNRVKNPQGIALDQNGTLYVADTGNSRIVRWINSNPNNGSSLALVGSLLGQVNRPEGVTVTQFLTGPYAGGPFLIVGDTLNNRIQGRFIPTSSWTLVGTPNNSGTGVGSFRNPGKIR
ncbi:MAG: PD40 domain-containing protein [Acidobacteria bacterium]|nr:PD40 domain-containing protein [Acidobacteriota bacterium]